MYVRVLFNEVYDGQKDIPDATKIYEDGPYIIVETTDDILHFRKQRIFCILIRFGDVE